MNMSLFDQVVNESYSADLGGYAEDKLDSATESYIDGIITDDPVTMVAFTGECMMGIMALEAAEARMEGMQAVKFMNARQAGNEDVMEQTVVAMEGFINNVWEALKEFVKKAYEAVKAFLMKVWNKMKGYGNVVKAMFTKYGDVLKHKNCRGCKVKWVGLANIDGITDKVDSLQTEVDNVLAQAQTLAKKKDPNDAKSNIGRHVGITNSLPSVDRINKEIEEAAGILDKNMADVKEVDFESNRAEILKAVEASDYSAWIKRYVGFGDKGYRQNIEIINEQIKKDDDTKYGDDHKFGHAEVKRCLNCKILIHRVGASVLNRAIQMQYHLAVAACRKAIMYHATDVKESYEPENQSGSTLDSFMSSYGF